MNTMTDNYLTPDALAAIERAKALAPKLAARAQQADREGKISDETVQEMAEAGLFRVLQPKRWGGYEMDPRVFYSVQMELAKGCMSTAWIYGVVGVHNWQLPLFPEQAQQDVWANDTSVLSASTYMPTGKAEAVEETCEGGVSAFCPASALQLHPHATIIVDEAAASRLRHKDYYKYAFEHKPAWQGI